MAETKLITDLAWDVPEEKYRASTALSYSTLKKFAKGGFGVVYKLDEQEESESLIFGSVVDTLITEGVDKFNEKFVVSDAVPSEGIANIIKTLVASQEAMELDGVDDMAILAAAVDYQPRFKPETKLTAIRGDGTEYYRALKAAGSTKTIIDTKTYEEAIAVVQALKNLPQTKKYFGEDLNNKYYQLKFKTTLNGIEFRCMFDLLIVNYEKKWILPVDLKTTGWPEYEFYKRYIECRYDIQSRLYWRILRKKMDEDPFFKQFKLYDFQFVCVNKFSLWPLAWCDINCKTTGELKFTTKTNRTYILSDPEDIAKDLRYYMFRSCKVPKDITEDKPNSIAEWIKQM